MESPSSSSRKPPPKKLKFAPKVPVKKEPKVITPTTDPGGTATESVTDSRLLNLVKQAEHGPGQRRAKNERKNAPMDVAFGEINASTANWSLGILKSGKKPQDAANNVKEYEDPWDYYSYYPTETPLRLPHSGDPEVLNKEEFGKSSSTYDESYISPANDLELTEDKMGEMIYFQFPSSLPSRRQESSAKKGKGIEDKRRSIHGKGFKLDEMPHGYMGKLLVHKSGAVKLKIGETLFNVSPGLDCIISQNVVSMNMERRECCVLGEIKKRAVVAPDLDDVLKSLSNL